MRDPSAAGAAHSLRTTATDYAHFTAQICRGDGLEQGLAQEMLRPQSPAPGVWWRRFIAPVGGTVSWGLSWGVLDVDGRRLHFHWGDNGAFKGLVVFERETGSGFVYFANGRNGLQLAPRMGELFMDRSLRPILRWLY